MNDFTKEELEKIWESLECDDTGFYVGEALINKIKSMADNYPVVNVKSIAKSHLNEACSLISHAMCLLGIENE